MQNRARTIKLVGAILGVCLLGTAVLLIVIRVFYGFVLEQPITVDVQVEAPEQVIVDEPFPVTLQLTNLITASQTLHSIDLENQYLENVVLHEATPTYKAVRSLPFTSFTSYEFDHEIPAVRTMRPTIVELLFVAEETGTFSSTMDICLADGTLCLALPLETAVIDK